MNDFSNNSFLFGSIATRIPEKVNYGLSMDHDVFMPLPRSVFINGIASTHQRLFGGRLYNFTDIMFLNPSFSYL